MTKKHFKMIAETLRQTKERERHTEIKFGISCAAYQLANKFAAEYPRFDKQKFLEAAGETFFG